MQGMSRQSWALQIMAMEETVEEARDLAEKLADCASQMADGVSRDELLQVARYTLEASRSYIAKLTGGRIARIGTHKELM